MMNNWNYHINKLILTGMIFFLPITTSSFIAKASTQGANNAISLSLYQQYINMHYKAAIRQQKKYKIPASIILAQALLESGAGQSYLALAGNNHFGIKGAGWKGLCVYKKDDGKRTCFRKYLFVSHSFEDHSRFLTERPNYKSLFKLKTTDYKSWSKGLKQSGYATDPQYASKLINLIESYQLYYYDTAKETDPPAPVKKYATSTAKKTPPKAQQSIQSTKKNTIAKKTYSSNKPNIKKVTQPVSSAKKR